MIRNRSKPRPRQLFLEGLESRQMLAVTATGSGIIRITGDNLANDVTVISTGAPGEFEITGLTPSASAPGGVKVVTNVRGFTVDLKGGNDSFRLGEEGEPVELLGNVSVNLGAGAAGATQTAELYVNTLGAVTVKGGVSNDEIIVANSMMRSLSVTGAAGDDLLNIDSSLIFSLTANLGVSSVRGTATDSDTFDIASSAVGTANITLGTAEVGGANDVFVDSTVFGSLKITGGARQDNIQIFSASEGIGSRLLDPDSETGLVDLVADLEPLLGGILGRVNVPLLLNQLDGLLGAIAGPIGLDLNGFDFNNFFAEGLSGAVANLLTALGEELGEEGLAYGDIGAQTTIGILNVNTAGGDDNVSIGEAAFARLAIPSIDDLRDAVANANVRILTTAIINTGDGLDQVALNNVFIGLSLSVLLGKHDDVLFVNQVTVAIATLNGGAHGAEGDTLDGSTEDLGYVRLLKSLFENDFTLVT